MFIETCKKHRILVLTPNIVYDFAHPLLGQFHIKQFRYKCEMAADYITTVPVWQAALGPSEGHDGWPVGRSQVSSGIYGRSAKDTAERRAQP